MRKLLLPLLLFVQVNSLWAIDCRTAVVQAYDSLDTKIDGDSFSNADFADFNVSVEEFNDLSTQEQEEIYIQVRPLEVMVLTTIHLLDAQISRYAGTFYEIYVIEELKKWRSNVDKLRSCSL